MTYNPNILKEVLKQRSLTSTALSSRLGIDKSALDSELSREPQPKQSLLNEIARELALPSFIFYMAEAPKLNSNITDFRLAVPAPAPKSRQTTEAIELARSIQNLSRQAHSPLIASALPQIKITKSRAAIDSFATEARRYFGIGLSDQKNAKNAKEFYVICRKKIEDKGIFVVHRSYPSEDGSGFCIYDPQFPIVVINTQQQTRGRRLFTLIHEIAHVLLKATGISDPFVAKNDVETFCNRFATAFLTPSSFVMELLGNLVLPSQPDLDDIKRAAARLKISQQATALRLEELGLCKEGTYTSWLRQIHNFGNPDFSEKSGGNGVPPPQEKVKLAQYGFRFASVFSDLMDREAVSAINLYRATGLKPKYQKVYFDFTNSLSGNDLTEELDDV